jgi:hypothetical protein
MDQDGVIVLLGDTEPDGDTDGDTDMVIIGGDTVVIGTADETGTVVVK